MMKKRPGLIINLVAVLGMLLAFSALQPAAARQPQSTPITVPGMAEVYGSPQGQPAARTSHRLIVELKSPPLAAWAETAPAARLENGKVNVKTPEAKGYLAQLKVEQAAFIAAMQVALPGSRVGSYINEKGASLALTYQTAFNGLAVEPGQADLEAARQKLMALPGVKMIYPDYAHQPDLYASIPLIDAPAAYNDPAIGGLEYGGQGIKVASMDGGVHHAAPMFSGAGYSYPPGFPAGGLGLTDNNNGKIIASRVYFRSWDPPTPGDENAWPGANGISHGVHTASIAAGEEVIADYLGITQTLHGVAPAAWVMSYRVFYPSLSGDISFYTAEGLAALEDIVKDGADVLNNSWGSGPVGAGGPFDPLDQALINAAQAGIFVSMSNGNSGPGKGTSDHSSPDYINVAPSTTTGTFAAGRFYASAPAPVDPDLQLIPYVEALFGSYLPLGAKHPFLYKTSASINGGANIEGCSTWPAGTFTGTAAVIRRGTCQYGQKVLYAEQAGAAFVVIYNNSGDKLIYMPPGTYGSQVTIPSVFIGNAKGQGLESWYAAHPADAEVTLDYIAYQVGNTPDVIPNFSSRGPGVGNVLKPDIAAPGVNILAQGYDPTATGEAQHLGWGESSGSSMAAPHVAGAAALLRQIHPAWSNAFIKSALMSTSKYLGVWNNNGSHAQPLDMGAGRLDLAHAADPGVILDPPGLGFGLAPTGTVKTLNVTLTSVAGGAETYSLSLLKVGGTYPTVVTGALPGFSITPSSVSLAPSATATFTVTFHTSQGDIGDNQGYIVLDGPTHDAHLPVWGRVMPTSPGKDVLIIQNDGSATVGNPDYLSYYTDALDQSGLSYDVWNADAHYQNPTTIPEAAVLSTYPVIIYFTGDYWQPNGSFSYSTPLTGLDLNRLTEYANNGGIVIAMGQDLASVWYANMHYTPANGVYLPFMYQDVLGGNWLQDSLTHGAPPTLTVVPSGEAPLAFQAIALDLSQTSLDEIESHPYFDPNPVPGWVYPYTPLLRYPGAYNIENGTLTMAHRAQPSLEYPGVAYYGRSIYATFGLEGVNNSPGNTSREDLLAAFLNWARDEPTVTIADATPPDPGHLTTYKATLASNIPGTQGVSYRWDFGDGSAFTSPAPMDTASHVYALCGLHTVRVEAVDSWGNHAIGQSPIGVTQCGTQWLPFILR